MALPEAERAALRVHATAALIAGGEQLVIDSLADLPAAIAAIEARLAEGQLPT